MYKQYQALVSVCRVNIYSAGPWVVPETQVGGLGFFYGHYTQQTRYGSSRTVVSPILTRLSAFPTLYQQQTKK